MDPIEVPVGDCRCPETPHPDGDVVYLAAELSMQAGLAVETAMTENEGESQTVAVAMALVNHNIIGWTFTDEHGVIAVTPANIARLLPYARGGEAVASRAAGLYTASFFAPLAERAASLKSRTKGRTRPILASHEPSRRRRSASSSRGSSAGKP